MRIGLDIHGGDYAPEAPLDGVALGLPFLHEGDVLVLYGQKEVLDREVRERAIPSSRIELCHVTQVIDMGEPPTRAVAQKPDSSIMRGLRDLKEGNIDIFISAGNTGAVFVGALYSVKAIEGILRPALAAHIPKEDGSFGLLLDIGANADCKPEVLYQFGLLGSVYAKTVLGIKDPKVGLLNMGTEPEKGNTVMQAAYPLFEKSTRFRFAGNIEGFDFFSDHADVLVTEGYTGNIILKVSESIFQLMKKRGYWDSYFSKYDFEEIGGAPILGINKPVVIAHGMSTPVAFAKMIEKSHHIITSRFTTRIKEAFELDVKH